jgi:hypothetical protein
MMNEQARQRFKEMLEAMQAQLQGSEAALKENAPPLP